MSQPRYEVLGPLRAWHGEAGLRLGPEQQQVVLAILLLHANQPLPRQRLVGAVWGESAPAYAVNLLQKHVSALRRVLEPARSPRTPSRSLAWTKAGYQLTLPTDDLDLDRFEATVRRARAVRTTGNLPAAAAELRTALAMWRGSVCEGLSSPLLDAERERWEERRVGLLEELVELDLANGEHRDLVTEVRSLVAEYPYRERLRGFLMLALYRSGRTAEALAAFHDTRRLLVDELGVEPSHHLRHLHERILQGDQTLAGPADRPLTPPTTSPATMLIDPPVAGGGVVPAQLPAQVLDFTGHQSALSQLDDMHRAGASQTPVAVVAGAAGVGKTALVVHWARRVAPCFPDGQLYVDLRGFTARQPPMAPAEVIRGLLEAFGVPTKRIPAAAHARVALYRSLLARRRMLVLLDNARDAEQVRPLLPGAPDCLVLVTSRDQLAGLLTAPGARSVPVSDWTRTESFEFLARRLGADRLAAEPGAVEEIITRCAGLPLALSVIAAQAALHPGFPLGNLAHRLRLGSGSLEAFTDDDAAADVRGAVARSYRELAEPAALMLRLLSLHPGPDIDPGAAASLAAVPVRQGAATLAALCRLHLVHQPAPGRFRVHDLVRDYAHERADHDPKPLREAALSRMYSYYLSAALAAGSLLGAATPSDAARASSWFAAERQVLLRVADQLTAQDRHGSAEQLRETLLAHLSLTGS